MKILVTGNSGYVGSCLTALLQRNGHEVGGIDIRQPVVEPDYFVKASILDEYWIKTAVEWSDAVVHLAGIVGFPACDANKDLAIDVNVHGTKIIGEHLGDRLIILASSQSVYGEVTDKVCHEDLPLNGASLYAETKIASEELLLPKKHIFLRFSTGFGVSKAMRFDSLVNNWTQIAFKDRKLEVFQPTAKRSFIHVEDMASSINFSIRNSENMVGEAFNVGSEKLNLTKNEIATAIKRRINCDIHEIEGSDKEKRDYYVSYDKIRTHCFTTTIDIEEGINDLVKYYERL